MTSKAGPAGSPGPPRAELHGIRVRFPENGVTANDGVDFDVRRGEVHALVGENGSGKSTLMHVLSGCLKPDDGRILLDGKPVRIDSPRRALAEGVGMVHQHHRLIREMRIWENIVLGAEPKGPFGSIDRKEAVEKITKLSQDYALDIDPRRPAGELSADGMQRVALLTVLFHKADLIILDEPSTHMEGERESIKALSDRLLAHGKTIILITHKLREALAAADRITVMRAGRIVMREAAAKLSAPLLSTLMFGEQQGQVKGRAARAADGKAGRKAGPLLTIERLSCREPGYPPIRGLSLAIEEGEVLSVTGIRENGLETLEHVLAGLVAPESGSVRFEGEEIHSFSPRELRRKGIAYIPTERLVRGASMESSIEENMILLNYRNFHCWGRLKKDEIEHYTGRLRHEYGIQGLPTQLLSALSGGNIQKVIISRELERRPRLVIFSEPSWGLDERSRSFILEKISLLAAEGSAVFILTSDLDEALETGHRIAVLFRGKLAGILERNEADRKRLGRLVLGLEEAG
jgi:general nucleoside transport system ATP-binding protein